MESEYRAVHESFQAGSTAPAAALSSPMKNHHRHHQYERHYQPAPGGIGPAMMCEMIKRNDLLRLSETVIKPFYYQRVQETIAIIRRYLPENRCLIHKPEGAIFLWLWFKDLPITTEQLYQRLKARGVLMVPGHNFFPGWINRGRIRINVCA